MAEQRIRRREEGEAAGEEDHRLRSCMGLLHPATLLRALYRVKFLKVEIALVLFMFARHVYNPLYEQYYYLIDGSDILRNTSFAFPNTSFCVSSELIDNYTHNNNSYKEDESFSNHLVAYGQLANTFPSVLTTLILGPVMDRHGRKIGIILPVVGYTLQGVLSIFIVSYTLHPYYFILAQFIGGVFGGFTCVLAASFAYVADISSLRWRSLRVALLEAAMAYGGAVGMFAVGYWLRKSHCDFIPPLLLYAGTCAAIVVYTFLLVPESLSRMERERLQAVNPNQRGLQVFVQGIRLYLGKLPLSSTWQLYVCSIVISVGVINIYGASLVEVYFLKALPFDFSSVQIGIYQSARSASQGTASLLFMMLLVVLKVPDALVILIAILVHSACNVLVGFANKAWQLYTSEGFFCRFVCLFVYCFVVQQLQE